MPRFAQHLAQWPIPGSSSRDGGWAGADAQPVSRESELERGTARVCALAQGHPDYFKSRLRRNVREAIAQKYAGRAGRADHDFT